MLVIQGGRGKGKTTALLRYMLQCPDSYLLVPIAQQREHIVYGWPELEGRIITFLEYQKGALRGKVVNELLIDNTIAILRCLGIHERLGAIVIEHDW